MLPGIFSAVAFIVTVVLTPVVIRDFKRRGISGIDLHKEGRPEIPEMVGVSILAAVGVSLGAAYLLLHDRALMFVFAVTMTTGLLGILDHYRPLTPAEKIAGLTIIGISYPLYLSTGHVALLILLPLLFMAACNFTNMLAGFNGLEIGTGAIASLGIAGAASLNGAWTSFIIASTMAGALLAFLLYNRYPARAFPGDVGTLIIGSALFSAVLFGGMYRAGVIVFIPYAADAGLKFISAGVMSRHTQEPTMVKEGKLYAPPGSNLSLPRLLLRIKPMGEREAVLWIWAVEALFVSAALALEATL